MENMFQRNSMFLNELYFTIETYDKFVPFLTKLTFPAMYQNDEFFLKPKRSNVGWRDIWNTFPANIRNLLYDAFKNSTHPLDL